MKNSPENNTEKYITSAPKEIQPFLRELRSIVRKAVPSATERTDYFDIPGYSCDQYEYYNGMFVWFSFKKPYIRLHVLPSVIQDNKKDLAKYRLTKSIISFNVDEKIPKLLIQKLVKGSRDALKMLSEIEKNK